MSDITGPPVPKPVHSPLTRGTERASTVSRDRQQATGREGEDRQDNKAKSEPKDTQQVRDPAVSIAASAAHLHIGEELEQKVKRIDPEGRPIIVTETATFALRPDAGLRPGDDVIIEVKETGKTVAADLLALNGNKIDPPIRLSLTVIAVHTPPKNPAEPAEPAPQLTISTGFSIPYKPTSLSKPYTDNLTQAEFAAQILGRTFNPASQPLSGLQSDNPDPTARSNSADLATLISTQQVQSNQQTTSPAPPTQPQPSANRLIPETDLTRLSSLQQAEQTAGVGPVITAATPEGALKNIQLIDPSISKVAPSEIAEVLSVKPLPLSEAKTLAVNPAVLGSYQLAKVETTKGTYILEQQKAGPLSGELVRVTNSAITAPHTAAPDAVSYKAKLTNSTGGPPRSVLVQFPQENTAVSGPANRNTEIAAVHVIRGYLTAEGPKNDLMLETPLGNLSLTLLNTLRPHVGDPVIILPTEAAQTATAAPALPLQGLQLATGSNWPAFEQTYSLIAAENPALASNLAARTAQGGGKLLNSATFLMSALGFGSKTSWLGEAENFLENRNSQLLDMLKKDIAQLMSAPERAGEWRSLMLPFDMRNGEASMLALLFGQGPLVNPDSQKRQGPEGESLPEDSKRFVVEVEFTILGPIQLNGFIYGKRFDLGVHSHKDFSASLKADSTELFNHALNVNDFSGQLSFVTTDTFPIDVNSVLKESR
ncbi:hypothetical protein [Kordiimonas pumila]|uniref:Flagellar hook-length control protein-like C-terminal domain-containing protein n=1 Tax=Kordiimonas pumila TaxID=2161677 RepID=A0ABV7D776_9PROT|nr:hypothetical protein [Kordiimonas pumila]